ncbi:hypothetical protein BBH99_20560 [Chryseobacterium contaminans]|uniref:Uncharacterized protein n=1 Tax=Chryseobacterium contaminans TaxID=1423959 RepID=A0A1M6XWY6_9FLAO|nr:hypothetical protein BBH99_20560 [Chryseobacterium contaminans]SHL10335.1 hypothetical protein SAMN05444407_102249 [Chryseobacterium contaminans]
MGNLYDKIKTLCFLKITQIADKVTDIADVHFIYGHLSKVYEIMMFFNRIIGPIHPINLILVLNIRCTLKP